jgi:hypothetical protein
MSAPKPHISLVVTDLDNTLYDWVTFFVTSFYRMVEVASELLDAPREQLLDELQAVHRRYHDSEYPFALLETDIVLSRFGDIPRLESKERLKPAFQAFNEARDETLRLWPRRGGYATRLSGSRMRAARTPKGCSGRSSWRSSFRPRLMAAAETAILR